MNDPNWLPEVDEIVDQSKAEKAADTTYHSFIGAEVIVPDASGNRRMAKVLRRARNFQGSTNNSTNMFNDCSIFKVGRPLEC